MKPSLPARSAPSADLIGALRADLRLPVGARVAVAMSGGVDSSVAAGLLVEAGYEVLGMTARLYDLEDDEQRNARQRPGTCCAPEDARDARGVARRLGIRHYVVDEREVFERTVIAPFLAAWRAGDTPNPCVECNRVVKFDQMVSKARSLGASALATGHYARLGVDTQGRPELRRGRDANKDQAYFLYPMTPASAAMLRFPLGGMDKDEVRRHAERLGLPVAQKRESMDICFVAGGSAADWVARQGGARRGDIVDISGMSLGRHENLAAFTVGQRRGLHIGQPTADGEPRYVLAKGADATVIVGPRALLAVESLSIEPCNAVGGSLPAVGTACSVQVRHRGRPVGATVIGLVGSRLELRIDGDLQAAAHGQSAVLFAGDRVLGGGLIVATRTAADAALGRLAGAAGAGR